MQPLPISDQIAAWHVSRAGNPTTDAVRYLERWMPLALQLERTSGIPAAFLLAQSALESSWGSSRICRLGNNYFGVKWYRGTPLYDGSASYQQYATPEESWEVQVQLLTNKTYRPALMYADDIRRYARAVQRLGYCPNTRYATIIAAIVEDFHLEEIPNG